MNFIENEPLSAHSNFKIGGLAKFFCTAKNEEDILAALREAGELSVPVFVLAGGTNILFSDAGFPGLVLKIESKFIKREDDKIIAGAGVDMGKLINFAVENNLSGLEWAGGLPGTLGGAIRGNAGAFKGEIKDSVESVRSLSRETLKITQRNNAECVFGYRNSIFRRDFKEIILSSVLSMKPGEKEKILSAVNEKINLRRAHLPLEYPNIGSIFKNVPLQNFTKEWQEKLASHIKIDPFPLIPAAVLISDAGLKGRIAGEAQISERHVNVIINLGGAKATDVLALIDITKKEVLVKFGILLEPEVEFMGF